MFKCVVVDMSIDEPGICYTGFESKEHAIEWLKENGFFETWRWSIFHEERHHSDINDLVTLRF